MGGKDGCKGRPEAATISDILYLFGQGNFIFIRKKSGKSQGILKTHVCGNHVMGSCIYSPHKMKKKRQMTKTDMVVC